MRRLLALIGILATLAALPAAGQRVVTKRARLTRAKNTEVTILSPCGSVSVRTAPGDEVRVEARLADPSLGLDVSTGSDGSSVLVTLTGKPSAPTGRARLDVTVPGDCSIRVYGTTDLVEVSGSPQTRVIDVSNRDGDVRITGSALAVVAASFSGNVGVEGSYASVSARTATGSITVQGSIGELETDTVSGLTRITAREVSHGRARSVSGDLRLACDFREPAPLNSLTLESTAGSIVLRVPPGLEASYSVVPARTYVSNPTGLLKISPGILASERDRKVGVTTRATGAVTVGGSVATLRQGAVTERSANGAGTVLLSDLTLSFWTGSDRTRISLRTSSGTIAIEPWEEVRP